MSAALHIGIAPCRSCRKPVLPSIARFCGSEQHGYLCPECAIAEIVNMQWLGQKLTEEADAETKVVLRPGDPSACVLCGSTTSAYQREVPIDGKSGYICADLTPMTTPCERKWAEGHRHYFSPYWQRQLKLI